jgi:hypothetical protein
LKIKYTRIFPELQTENLYERPLVAEGKKSGDVEKLKGFFILRRKLIDFLKNST